MTSTRTAPSTGIPSGAPSGIPSGNRIEDRKARWAALQASDAPGGFVFHVNVAETRGALPSRPWPWPSKKEERIDWALRIWEYRMAEAEYLHDDRIPHLKNITGTEVFAEALGCEVFRPDTDMPCARHRITEPEEVDDVEVPEIFDSTLAYLFEIGDTLRARSAPDAVVQPVDIQSPMDIAALVWEKVEFLTAMIEEPEAVEVLAEKAHALLTAFMDEWFRRYGVEHVAHYPDYYMSGGLTLSEDEVGVVDPAMFRRFFLPHLNRLSARYGGLGIHCCASARHQWENFKSVEGLRVLNLVNPHHLSLKEYVEPAIPFFADAVLQYHMPQPFTGPVETWLEQVPEHARMVFDFEVQTKAEGIELCARMNELRRRRFA